MLPALTVLSVYIRTLEPKEAMRTRPLGLESVSRYTSCAPVVRLLGVQLNITLLPATVAFRPIVPVDTALELEDTEELDALLEDTLDELEDATELDDLLDDETGTELAIELELLVAPQAEAVRVAPFLPTPA